MGEKICVIGLGYVGLPLAIQFDRVGHQVIGYDIDKEKIKALRGGSDPTGEIGDDLVKKSGVEFKTDDSAIQNSDYLIVAVPTPVDDLKNPNLKYVESAGETIGRYISEGATVILESTVYPGATREILAPAIEQSSGLTVGKDFYIGYSPERMVPGNDERGLRDVVKIVSGQNEAVLKDIASLYETIVSAGVHHAPEIEVAEASKCIENIQRDLNIALVNELAIACNNLELDTQAVLEAAGTKWNFHDYHPGLVGGHCIPVDPFFMIYESKRNGYSPQLIEQAREVNEYMPKHIAQMTIKGLNDCGKILRDSTVLILGLAYKPGVGDVRTSPVQHTIEELRSYDLEIVGHDPHTDTQTIREQFGIEAQDTAMFDDIDAILLATPHEEYFNFDYKNLINKMAQNPVIIDVTGELSGLIEDLDHIQYRRV